MEVFVASKGVERIHCLGSQVHVLYFSCGNNFNLHLKDSAIFSYKGTLIAFGIWLYYCSITSIMSLLNLGDCQWVLLNHQSEILSS